MTPGSDLCFFNSILLSWGAAQCWRCFWGWLDGYAVLLRCFWGWLDGSWIRTEMVSFSLEVLRSVGDASGDGWMATQCC